MNEETMQLLENYPCDVTELIICNGNINGILDLKKFTNLETLRCSINQITHLYNLPNSLHLFTNQTPIIRTTYTIF